MPRPARPLEQLIEMANRQPRVTHRGIAAQLGIPLGSVSRLTHELIRRGLVEPRYRTGVRVAHAEQAA